MTKPKLTLEDMERVVRLLAAWEGKITWELTVDKVAEVLRRSYTRQTLESYSAVKIAFQKAKVRHRGKTAPAKLQKGMTPELAAALSRIEVLKAELEISKGVNGEHMQQFAKWLYNARSRGISEMDLNRPLPIINRGASEKKK